MKIELWLVGKTSFSYLQEGTDIYTKRLKHYIPFKIEVIPDIKKAKNLSKNQLKEKEGEIILKKLKPTDYLILLDERGRQMESVAFAGFMEKLLHSSHSRVVFLVGGAYGFSENVYKRGKFQISLSKMTFSHQMIRLFFTEQLYRAMTILKNEPYHHQ